MNSNNSIHKIQSLCRKARIGAIVLFCICIAAAAACGISFVSVAKQAAGITQSSFAADIASHATAIAHIVMRFGICVVYGIALLICSGMFRGICDDQTPFRERTVRAMRNMSLLMLVSAVVPSFLGFLCYAAAAGSVLRSMPLGLIITQSGLNVAAVPLFLSVFLFTMTAVFRYGCILQQESDETL